MVSFLGFALRVSNLKQVIFLGAEGCQIPLYFQLQFSQEGLSTVLAVGPVISVHKINWEAFTLPQLPSLPFHTRQLNWRLDIMNVESYSEFPAADTKVLLCVGIRNDSEAKPKGMASKYI